MSSAAETDPAQDTMRKPLVAQPHHHDQHPNGARPGHDAPMVDVQPPRREDLQPSYAQVLVGEGELGNNGWYGSMSTSHQISPVR